jgi:hypothetical protein
MTIRARGRSVFDRKVIRCPMRIAWLNNREFLAEGLICLTKIRFFPPTDWPFAAREAPGAIGLF